MRIPFFVSYVVDRLKESSTWATILSSMSAQFNLHLNPEMNTWIVQLGVCLATGAGILIKEGWSNAKDGG